MTLKPEKSYFIDYKPESEKVDLIDRVKLGVEQAKKDGFEYAFIIEDDDAYPKDYFERFDIGEHSFYGSQETTYYNLRSRTHSTFKHHGRSSLFTTGFKISELKYFNWSAPKRIFLDIAIWEHAVSNSNGVRQYVHGTGAIGIKHNLGLCAGKGHTLRGTDSDDNLTWLKANTDSEQFEFYSALMKKL